MNDSSVTRIERDATIPDAAAGRRLDAVLAELFPEFSRSRLQRWLRDGELTVDGGSPRGRVAVKGGEQIRLAATASEEGVVTAEPSDLRAIRVERSDVVRAIDELPAVAAAAVRAEGVTSIRGAEELRHKETDRIRAMVDNLRAIGVACEEHPDGLDVEGTDIPLRGTVDARDDHRIAMVFGVLAAQRGNDITIRGRECVDVSFPDFWELLERITS